MNAPLPLLQVEDKKQRSGRPCVYYIIKSCITETPIKSSFSINTRIEGRRINRTNSGSTIDILIIDQLRIRNKFLSSTGWLVFSIDACYLRVSLPIDKPTRF